MRQSGPDLSFGHSWAKKAPTRPGTAFDYTGMDLPVPVAELPQLGTAFARFAQWVFGPDGISSPRLPAYGDFSYDGRFGSKTLLLCRREIPDTWSTCDARYSNEFWFLRFRLMKEGEDRELWELYEREFGVLAACLTGSLLRDLNSIEICAITRRSDQFGYFGHVTSNKAPAVYSW